MILINSPKYAADCVFIVKRVKRFWIHPRFNVHARAALGVIEFYDYDVALIQLMEDVVISTAVR